MKKILFILVLTLFIYCLYYFITCLLGYLNILHRDPPGGFPYDLDGFPWSNLIFVIVSGLLLYLLKI